MGVVGGEGQALRGNVQLQDPGWVDRRRGHEGRKKSLVFLGIDGELRINNCIIAVVESSNLIGQSSKQRRSIP